MKNEKSGFSLIEVLIALIIISLVTSAMAPVISKKLIATGAFITVKGGGSAFCDAGQYLEDSGSCADCPKGFFCVNNEKIQCLEGQISDVAQSACTTCENGFYANETQDKCIKCEAGNYCTQGKKTTCPDGSISTEGQYFCTSCPEGYYCQNGEQKSCESKFTNCTTCTQSACLSCKKGYDIQNKTCVLKGFSQAFCDSLGSNLLYLTASQNGGTAACVTKANVGDTYAGGPDLDEINANNAGINAVNIGEYCRSDEMCCWYGNNKGQTAGSCTDTGNGNSTYSGCKRTVCNWRAAMRACERWEPKGSNTKGKWRLPTVEEFTSWGYSIGTLQPLGKDGIQFCSGSNVTNSVQCSYREGISGCYDGARYICHPDTVWTSKYDRNSGYATYFYTGGMNLSQGGDYTYYSRSTRCVLDEETYKNKKGLFSQSDCDKIGSKLLYLSPTQNNGKAACITKANVGDSKAGGPDLDKINNNGASITVLIPRDSCNLSAKSCCWLGNGKNYTSYQYGGCTSGSSGYSGCTRTVCTFEAAKSACENWEPIGSGTKGKWRLPTKEEMGEWSLAGVYKEIQLCDANYGDTQCSDVTPLCKGTYDDRCTPFGVWSSEGPYYYAYSAGGSFYTTSGTNSSIMGAFSARCVLDEDAVKSL